MSGSFHTPLILEYLDGRLWMVKESFTYTPSDECDLSPALTEIRVPSGYVTDFASVPRWAWWLFPPTGEYGKAAVVHNYLYSNPYMPATKEQADCVFYEAMGVLGVDRWTQHTMYFAVAGFGVNFAKRPEPPPVERD